MKIIEKSLDIAYKLFPERNDKFIHFAFIFDKNKLISIGQNDSRKPNRKALYFGERYKVNQLQDFPFLCAETSAISKIWSKIYITSKMSLVVIRLGQSGKLRNSKPCSKCQTILNGLGLNKVYWSTDNGFVSNQGLII